MVTLVIKVATDFLVITFNMVTNVPTAEHGLGLARTSGYCRSGETAAAATPMKRSVLNVRFKTARAR